jgi:hypothetical protein
MTSIPSFFTIELQHSDMISKKVLVVAAIAAISLFALLHRAAAQSTTAFDGSWWVTMGAQDYDNRNIGDYRTLLSSTFRPRSLTGSSTESVVLEGSRPFTNSTVSSRTAQPCYRPAALPENKSTARNSFHRVLLIRTP